MPNKFNVNAMGEPQETWDLKGVKGCYDSYYSSLSHYRHCPCNRKEPSSCRKTMPTHLLGHQEGVRVVMLPRAYHNCEVLKCMGQWTYDGGVMCVFHLMHVGWILASLTTRSN